MRGARTASCSFVRLLISHLICENDSRPAGSSPVERRSTRDPSANDINDLGAREEIAHPRNDLSVGAIEYYNLRSLQERKIKARVSLESVSTG